MRIGKYSAFDTKKINGCIYTPREFANFVSSRIIKLYSKLSHLKQISILDPAIGDGELIISLLEKLENEFNGEIKIYGYDLDEKALSIANSRIKTRFPNVEFTLKNEDFLTKFNDFSKDNSLLFKSQERKKYDIIIANPPYVRIQSIQNKLDIKRIAANFGLKGKIDLYQTFIVAIKYSLNAHGFCGIIVPNRILSTKTNRIVREFLANETDLHEIWDFGDTKLFDAAVLPAVLFFSSEKYILDKKHIPFTSIYETPNAISNRIEKDIFKNINEEGIIKTETGSIYTIKKGELLLNNKSIDEWTLTDNKLQAWKSIVQKNTWKTFGEIGRIRVGIKTCADKIFLRSDWNKYPDLKEEGLIFPLITHHIAAQIKPLEYHKNQKKVLYPYDMKSSKRKPVSLKNFPNTSKYLESYREQLCSRSYLIDARRRWYELWVPHEPSLWTAPKIVFRDISIKPTFWVDLSGAIVNGDCYWLSFSSDNMDLLWLAVGVANSKFIEQYYDTFFNNKLYSGRRRFMTQYVTRFPIPDIKKKSSQKIIKLVQEFFYEKNSEKIENSRAKYLNQIDRLVFQAFGL